MSRMFTIAGKVMKTWDPFTGCNFGCYNGRCWAKLQVEGRLKHLARYKAGFVPTVHPDRFTPRFKPGEFVFVVSKGDISFAPEVVWDAVRKVVLSFPHTSFLLQSKSPMTFPMNIRTNANNVYFGTTLETNKAVACTCAPSTYLRYRALLSSPTLRRSVSIEPVADFDPDMFIDWLQDIKPEMVFVGADNYHSNLPEPSWDKVQQLLEGLRKFVPLVVEKEGLERLKK